MSAPDGTVSRQDVVEFHARDAQEPLAGSAEETLGHLADAGRVLAFPQRQPPAAPPSTSLKPCTHWERTLNEVKARLRAAATERFEMGSATGRSADAALSRLQADTLDCVTVLNHLHLKMVLEFRRLKHTERELLEVQAALAHALTALQARGEEPR